MTIVREGKEIKTTDYMARYVQIRRIAYALENGDANKLSQEDIKAAAEMLAADPLSEVDLADVEDIVKEQIILELAGIEKCFEEE